MIVRAALVQMHTEYDVEKNVARARDYIRQAADGGASLVCLQELFNTVYFCHEMDSRHFNLAEPVAGPTITAMRELADELDVTLVAPFFERTDAGLYYNSAAFIGPDGGLLGLYRKSHIPLVSDPSLVGLEKYYFTPGDTGFRTFDLGGARIGSLICYDRHFPEGARQLALNGAAIVVIPTATGGMSRYLWDLELRAHAVDNVYYVGGVNRVGVDAGGGPSEFYGSSMWISPLGEVLAQASATDDEVLVADLDLSALDGIRTKWGFFRDRRPDLYAGLTA